MISSILLLAAITTSAIQARIDDAWRIDRPTENVLIRDCEVASGHAVLGIGSEISGGVRNVLMKDCTAGDVYRAFYLKTAYAAVKKNATVPQHLDTVCNWRDRGMFGRAPETRGGLHSYMTRGYVACDITLESVSRTTATRTAGR